MTSEAQMKYRTLVWLETNTGSILLANDATEESALWAARSWERETDGVRLRSETRNRWGSRCWEVWIYDAKRGEVYVEPIGETSGTGGASESWSGELT